ncbi:MAG: hypothetical protein KF817_16055 [Phycisphaeraceae bacterium]|nr:hypothetical protein [Phycisphaeraceae bacterium]
MITAVLFVTAACVTLDRAARADSVHHYNGFTVYYGAPWESFGTWSNDVVYVSSILFTEIPPYSFVTTQYTHLGVEFVSITIDQVFGFGILDGASLDGNMDVRLAFDAPIRAVGLHTQSQGLRFHFYRNGNHVVSTHQIPIGGGMQFLGIVTEEEFDFVYIQPDGFNVLPDNIHFATVPTDCNGNGIADAPEAGEGLAPDCNANGMPDECDIASGVSLDRDGDGVPDECNDCTGSGQMDWMDIAAGLAADCNGNGIPDQCDIAGGWSEDCDGNGVPDECEISYPRSGESPVWGPPAANDWYVHTLWDVGRAGTDVTLTLSAHGDLDLWFEYVDVYFSTVLLGRAFEFSKDCADVSEQMIIPREMWNTLIEEDGWDRARIWLRPSGGVSAAQCPDGYLRWTMAWQSEGTGDLDTNGIVDACETPACPADLDGSGHVEFADLLSLLSVFGPCEAPCPADFDGNGAVDFMDLLLLLAAWGPCG